MKTKFIKSIAVTAVLIFISIATLNADVIHLKNGGKIKGTVVSDADGIVTIDIGGGTVVQNKRDVVRVDKENFVPRPRSFGTSDRRITPPKPRTKLTEIFNDFINICTSVMRGDFLKRAN
jgi:hypothetical protein